MNEYGTWVECFWLCKTEELIEKSCLVATLSTTNPTWVGLGLNPHLHSGTNCLNHGVAWHVPCRKHCSFIKCSQSVFDFEHSQFSSLVPLISYLIWLSAAVSLFVSLNTYHSLVTSPCCLSRVLYRVRFKTYHSLCLSLLPVVQAVYRTVLNWTHTIHFVCHFSLLSRLGIVLCSIEHIRSTIHFVTSHCCLSCVLYRVRLNTYLSLSLPLLPVQAVFCTMLNWTHTFHFLCHFSLLPKLCFVPC